MSLVTSLIIIWFLIVAFIVYVFYKEKKKVFKKSFKIKKDDFKRKIADKISETFFKAGGGVITYSESKNLQKKYFSYLKKIQPTIWIFSLGIAFFLIFPAFSVSNDKIMMVMMFLIINYLVFLPKSIKKALIDYDDYEREREKSLNNDYVSLINNNIDEQ